MLNLFLLQFVMVHLMTCFWYLAATMQSNIFDTWVGARGVVQESTGMKYAHAFYWAY